VECLGLKKQRFHQFYRTSDGRPDAKDSRFQATKKMALSAARGSTPLPVGSHGGARWRCTGGEKI